MSLKDRLAEDLSISMLAVNNYPLSQAYDLREKLRNEGFFDPKVVTSWTTEDRIERLRAAGYDRGGYLPLLSDRLMKLAEFLNSSEAKTLQDELANGSKERVDQILRRIYGIGPAVIENFWLLQDKSS